MPHATCTTARPLPAVVLDDLGRQIAEAHADDDHASLVRARPSNAGAEIGLCALPAGVHPAEALLGHVVPPAWSASGVVAPARARSLDRPDEDPTATVVVMVVGRDGHVAHHATGGGAIAAAIGADAPVGRIPDLLRRTLGLPTAPPTFPAATWWRAHWLDSLVSAAAADPARPPDPRRPLTSTLPRELVQALVDEPGLCEVDGWAQIRAWAARPSPPRQPGPAAVRRSVSPHIDPSLAAWMDDGCFSRWLLDCLPAIDELLALADALVAPDLAAQLHQVAGDAWSGPST